MKPLYIFSLLAIGTLAACKKIIDLIPESNLSTITYYSNLAEIRSALNGAYNGLQTPMLYEWQLTELRSDNSKQGVPASTSSVNRDLSDLDVFSVSPSHAAMTSYWQACYFNIRNANIILQKLGVVYDTAAGKLSINDVSAVSLADKKQVMGEALFLRAYQYFNLVRLFGGVFLITEPILPEQARGINRTSVTSIYKLIETDLRVAADSMATTKYTATSTDLGRANSWAAKALLAKVYLTQGRKAEAITLLNDVRTNSGYALQSTYANVFSTANEANSEILFSVRYKAGGLGLGATFANLFGPLGSGSLVVAGDGSGLNYPTADFDTTTNGDPRKTVIMGTYGTGSAGKLYVKKYLTTGGTANDSENDWPVLRFADVLLMLAEAQGYSQASLDLINLVRVRAGLTAYTTTTVANVAQFEAALSKERRIEFAFENQRWFDLLRFNTTLTTITAEQTIKNEFARDYAAHYSQYTAPALPLAQLQANVTRDHLLLPIPQREIDNNTSLVIPQNPGY